MNETWIKIAEGACQEKVQGWVRRSWAHRVGVRESNQHYYIVLYFGFVGGLYEGGLCICACLREWTKFATKVPARSLLFPTILDKCFIVMLIFILSLFLFYQDIHISFLPISLFLLSVYLFLDLSTRSICLYTFYKRLPSFINLKLFTLYFSVYHIYVSINLKQDLNGFLNNLWMNLNNLNEDWP